MGLERKPASSEHVPGFRCYPLFISFNPMMSLEVRSAFPVLFVRKLRFRRLKTLAKIVSKWKS